MPNFNSLYGIADNQESQKMLVNDLYGMPSVSQGQPVSPNGQTNPFGEGHRLGVYDWLSDRGFYQVDQSRRAALLSEYREKVVPWIAQSLGEDPEAAKLNFDAELPHDIKQATKPIERGWWEATNDNVVNAGNAVFGLAKSVTDAYDPDSAASKLIQGVMDQGNESLSPYLKDQQLRRALDRAEAKGDGGNELLADLSYYGRNPSAAVSELLGNIGAIAATGGIGGIAGKVGSRAAMMGLGAASGAGEVRGDIYEHINNMTEEELKQYSPQYNSLLAYGFTPEHARKQIATDIQNNKFEIGMGAALGSIDGLFGAEKVIAEGASKGVKGLLKTMGSEAAQEAIQEGGGQLLANNAIRKDDPRQDLFDNVAASAGVGALMGAAGGGLVEGSSRLANRQADEAQQIVNAAIDAVQQNNKQITNRTTDLFAIPANEKMELPPISDDINTEVANLAVATSNNPEHQEVIKSELMNAISTGTVQQLAESDSLSNHAAQLYIERQEQKSNQPVQEVAQEEEQPQVNPLIKETEQVNANNEAVVLQNRDRSTPQSIEQMNNIAANPDAARLLDSRSMNEGAPIVEENPQVTIPDIQKGHTSYVVDEQGRRTPIQYAVVEADTLLPSNNVDGSSNAEYATGNATQMRAIGGNGRVAGLKAAYERGTANNYKEGIASETTGTGINADVVRGMRKPVLVRIVPRDSVTADMGDRTNISGTAQLNPVEQARNDARRIDVSALRFTDDGLPDFNSASNFVQAMPQSERVGLLDQNGQPTRQAIDRIMNTVFHEAYGDSEILNLYAASTDPEIKNILLAMAKAAGSMSKLKGAGALDIRDIVVEAAKMAANAKRNGIALRDLAQQADLDTNPEVYAVAEMMAANVRSAKRMGEILQNVADFAYDEATKPDTDLMGDVPKATRNDVLERFKNANEQQSTLPMEDTAGGGYTAQSNEQNTIDTTGQGTPNQAETVRPTQTDQERQPVTQTDKPSSNDEGFSLGEEKHVQDIKQAVVSAVGEKNAQHIEIITQEQAERPEGVQSLNLDGVEGYYNPNTGVVTLIADNLTPETAGFVAWHELGHKGIHAPQFLRFQTLLRHANNNKTIKQLADKIVEARQGTGDPATTNRLIAVEEAIVELLAAKNTGNWSHLEAKYGMTFPDNFKGKEGSALTYLMRKFKEILAVVMGRKEQSFSDQEVIDLLHKVNASIAISNQESTSAGDMRFSLNESPNSAFSKAVDKVAAGEKVQGHINVGTTPDVLKMLGLPDVNVFTDGGVLHKVMLKKHKVSPESLKRLPKEINNPVAIMRSSTRENGFVVLTELMEHKFGTNKPVIAALHLKYTEKGIALINIASVYGRDLSQIRTGIEENLIYWNEEKGSRFMNRLTLQLRPGFDSIIENPHAYDVKTDSDLRQYIADKNAKNNSQPTVFSRKNNNNIDEEYLQLAKRYEDGDTSVEPQLRAMVDEQARKNGFDDDNSFRMNHQAPYRDEEGFNKSADDVSEMFGDEIYSPKAVEYYGHGDPVMDRQSMRAILTARGNPEADITIYRAVPKSLKGTGISNGDWVTTSISYAKLHGESHIQGDYKIVKKVVKAKDLFTNGDSIHEWGYDNGQQMLRSKTADRSKLNDLVTRDDNGNIIPLSEQFNPKSKDIRFSRQRDSKTPLVNRTPTVKEMAKSMTNSESKNAIKSFFTEGGKAVQPKWLETLTTLVFDAKAPISNILRRFNSEPARELEHSLRTYQAVSQKATDMFLDDYYKPMMGDLKDAWSKKFKALYKDFGNDGWKQFLLDIDTVGNLVKHGRERNAEILRKTEGKDKAGSGRTDEEIDEIEAVFNKQVPGLIEFYESLYKSHLKPMLDYRDKTLRDAGLLTPEMEAARADYEWYVPLYGDPNEDGTSNNGFFMPSTPEIKDIKDKQAKGRSGTLADNVLQNVMTAAQTAINRAGQQTFLYRLFDFAEKTPAARALMKIKVNTPEIKEIFEKYVDKDGLVKEKLKLNSAFDKDCIIFRNGNEVRIMKIGNKRILEALQGLNKAHIDGLFAITQKATRGLSSVYTRYNPMFPVMNKLRDSMSQVSFIFADAPVKNKAMVAWNTMRYNAQFTAQVRNNPNSEYSQWRDKYEKLGGSTMYIDIFRDDVMANISEDFAKGVGATTVHQFKAMKDAMTKLVDGINDHFEMTSRVAAFKALVEGGMSEKDAALYVKNLMNFETRGKYGQQMGAFYSFANAALFDARRMMQSLRTPRGAMVMAAHIAMMYFLYGALKALGGDDEDGIARLNKNALSSSGRYLIFIDPSDPEGKGFKLPVGFGYGRISLTIAASIHRLMDGVDSKEEFVTNVLKEGLVANLSPLEPIDISPTKDPFAYITQQFAPTVLRPVIQLSMNKTGQGAPIHNPDEWVGQKLKFDSAWPNTNKVWSDIAKFVYDKTGYDGNPEKYRFLVQSYFGTGGMELFRGFMLTDEKVGTELSLGDIPLAQAFAHKGDRYDMSSYLEKEKQVKRLVAERNYAYEQGWGYEFDAEHPGVGYLSQLFKETTKIINKLKKERKEFDNISDPLERQQKTKELTQKIRRYQMQANKAVRDYEDSLRK